MNPKVSVAGAVLAIVGGLLILVVGAIVSAFLHAILSGFSIGGGALTGILVLGPIVGVLIIIFAVLDFVLPALRLGWGLLIIILAIVSLFTTAIGGVFLGFLLALIGGILIMVKRAPPPPSPMAAPMGVPPPPPS